MKIWVKLLVGAVLGAVLGFLLPWENEKVMSVLGWFEQFALHIGRYSAIPLLFFALVIAVYELASDKEFWPLVGFSFLFMAGSAIFVILSGIIVTILFPPARLPIQNEGVMEELSLGLAEMPTDIFPSNMFSALFSDGLFLLPLFVFAFFLGLGLSYEKNYCKPVTSLFDSLSRVFYHIGVVFTEFLALAIIALSAFWAVRFHAALRAEVFRDLILLLGIFSVVLVFGIFPLFLYLLKPQKNPWHLLYGILGPSIGAFFSGDMNFSLPLLVRHVKENLGVRRRSSSVSLSLFAVFGRAGSAMVAASAFIVIIKSYSLLDISPTDVLTIGLRALLISFALGRFPGSGAYTALAVLGMGYGSIFEAGYLILRPLAFYLIAVGAFIDVVIAALCSYAVGKISGFQEDKEARHFI